jgi:hypothetical protein
MKSTIITLLIMASGFSEKQAYYQAFNKNNHILGGWRQIIVEAVLSEAVSAFLNLSALHQTGTKESGLSDLSVINNYYV